MRSRALSFFLLALCAPAFANVVITTASLPSGTVGVVYSASVQAANGCYPYVWKITGALPPGIASTSTTTSPLVISGTPTSAGNYSFSISVTGCGKHVSTRSYTIAIANVVLAHTVDLNWVASTSPDVAGYNVYRSQDKANWSRINTGGLVASTYFNDANVVNGATYYYGTTAVDLAGLESSRSNIAQVVIP